MEILTNEKIEYQFAKAVQNVSIDILRQLINPIGEYEIQDMNLETIEVSKEDYIQWIVNKRNEIKQLDYYFDQCLLCRIGNPVVIFNNGDFPRVMKNEGERCITGLMLNVRNEKIDVIKFCYTFLNIENRYGFEIIGAAITKYMTDHSCDFDTAYHVCKKDKWK